MLCVYIYILADEGRSERLTMASSMGPQSYGGLSRVSLVDALSVPLRHHRIPPKQVKEAKTEPHTSNFGPRISVLHHAVFARLQVLDFPRVLDSGA